MTVPVLVRVTESDIERGQMRSASECPVALAASRALGCPVVAGASFLHVQRPEGTSKMLTPTEAALAILRWDQGEYIEPFDFVVHDRRG